MPASIPTLALTTPADAKAFWEAFPSAPEGPERAVWEDRLIEALALEWFRIRQGLIEEKGAEFASQAYQINWLCLRCMWVTRCKHRWWGWGDRLSTQPRGQH